MEIRYAGLPQGSVNDQRFLNATNTQQTLGITQFGWVPVVPTHPAYNVFDVSSYQQPSAFSSRLSYMA